MRILLTNDDGVYAPGLRALRKELQKLGEVVVVHELVDGHQLDGRDAEVDEVGDGGGVGEARIRAAELRRDTGVGGREVPRR